ncbi:hypothetical protein AN639_03445 [Candidatus Epulonipiscium fishelsonii]|uniref:Uncharacterized protein n=1 Tax=Candidatus Epulonipiscium fishelsonii TaxID=77094 RepID=A0ACC8X8D1_9FIRM|nr:hypothetical protein AN396_11400 [Epulopiscium sp. SCG-B11WGA-EpuloA1]ONI41546.1 hypothetical protein AN639_03445 [Epulopiscium sp. SCG-B05WGA-EpuloA1]ONI46827.1 hypothetical protein AN644_02465 [Epulopiscium sp. SCG-C06WGA-EpuloA1]
MLEQNLLINKLTKFNEHMDDNSLDIILDGIKDYMGVDFNSYKKNTIFRRIERRMNMLNIEDLNNYIEHINNFPDELNELYNEIFIGVTEFFRDVAAFELLENKVIPALFSEKKSGDTIRIWSAGCSTGEEVYSLAILIKEYLDTHNKFFSVKIFATDLKDSSLTTASNGIYSAKSLVNMSQERLNKYFKKVNGDYQIVKSIRDMIIFTKHNLISDPPFSKLDLISCRNLLIYLDSEVQQNIFSIFHFSLNKTGYLFLGASESVGDMGKYFSVIDSKWKIFKYAGQPILPKQNTFQIRKLDDFYKEKSIYVDRTKKLDNYNIDKSINRIVETLQNTYIPKGIIVNQEFELIHTIGDVNEYIRIPSNRVSLNLLKMIRKDLSVAVGTALNNVFTENKSFKYKNIRILQNEKHIELAITVKPYIDSLADKKFAIILFEEQDANTDDELIEEENFEFQQKVYERISDLEYELKTTREYLQALIEELESSNEELQSTNEELVSSNEELRNTNEELQSVNEELSTVNVAHHQKIEELIEVNDYINNLLAITNISAIFLDKNLRIKRFTPAVRKVINLIDSDVGRPLTDIYIGLKYDTFIKDIEDVLKNFTAIEKIVETEKGGKYKIVISPYVSIESTIRGVIINLTELDSDAI